MKRISKAKTMEIQVERAKVSIDEAAKSGYVPIMEICVKDNVLDDFMEGRKLVGLAILTALPRYIQKKILFCAAQSVISNMLETGELTWKN